jgi:prolyl oligopeptidase
MHALLACALLASQSALASEPPVARKVDVVDHAFGLSIPDPYRWMEGEDNAEYKEWLKAHGAASRARLDALPTIDAWRRTLAAAAGATTTHGGHVRVGNRMFFRRAPAGKEGVLTVREADGSERVLFDPNTVDGGASIGDYSVSPDGGTVAATVGYGGNEIGDIALFDVATGKRLADTLKPVWDEFIPQWLPDGSGFFYVRMRDFQQGDADPMKGMGAYLHRLGQPQSADLLLARAGTDDALKIAAQDFPVVVTTHGSPWTILFIAGARASSPMCFAPLADVVAAHAKWRCLVAAADNVQGATLHGDTLYLLSARDASNRRVLALDLRDPKASLANAKVVVPERADAVLTDLGVARDGLYLKSMRRGLDSVDRMDYASGTRTPVAMPGEGAIYLMRTDPRQNGALMSLQGWTVPKKVYAYDGQALTDTGLGTLGAPAYPELIAEETEATSADGTRVPLSVVRRGGCTRPVALPGRRRRQRAGRDPARRHAVPAFGPGRIEPPRPRARPARPGGQLGEREDRRAGTRRRRAHGPGSRARRPLPEIHASRTRQR